MLCDQCKEDRTEKEFFKSTICYKCTYKNKMLICSDNLTKKKLCKICKNEIPKEKAVYRKAAYCSNECAKQGKYIHNHTYWVRKCNVPKIHYRLQYGKSE